MRATVAPGLLLLSRVFRTFWRLSAIVAIGIGSAGPAGAQSKSTAQVFQRFADNIVQIRVVERSSGAKSATGSGFHVNARGHLVTNYHVVAQVVLHPERYLAECIDRGGTTRPVTVLAIDVVHDLAVLGGGAVGTRHLPPLESTISQGTRLFSFGYPLDLGLSIVDGTYNGLLEHTLYQRIHFSGSLNPGMSGGPTITDAGAVVGVNVRTSGNQVSFLVPIAQLRPLLVAVESGAPQPPLLEMMRQQLLAHQEAYFASLLNASPVPTVTVEGLTLPGALATFLHCWGDFSEEHDRGFQLVSHRCSTEDEIFVAPELTTGVAKFSHRLVSAPELNRFQFHSLLGWYFHSAEDDDAGDANEHLTAYRCRRGLVRQNGTAFKTALCLRGYRRLPGLYDALLKVAVLGGRTHGGESDLTLSGVTVETVERVVTQYLGVIAWTTSPS